MTHGILVVVASAWAFGWEALVAIGTLGLAIVTAGLAWSTRGLASETADEVKHSKRQVDAALEQVEVSQRQAKTAHDALDAAREQTRISQLTLNAQIRPVLIDMPLDLGVEERLVYPGRDEPIAGPGGGVHVFAGPEEAVVSIPFRNAGAGLAMVRGVGMLLTVEAPAPPVMIQPANVPAGERGRVSFRATPSEVSFALLSQVIQDRGSFSIEVGYSDLAGQQYTITRFDVYFRSHAHTNWEVRQVHLQEPGADAPFAGSAPVA
jgi:hypothetical protein